MRIIKVKENQSLFDVALQEYGHIDGVHLLVTDNNWLHGLTHNIYQDDELLVREKLINEKMKDYLSVHELATVKDSRAIGIGFWRIEKTFKIS